MFLRTKRTGRREYLLLVENHWDQGLVRQRTLHNFGPRELVDPKEVRRIPARMHGNAYLDPDTEN
jgi:hypothetical protein